MSDEQQVTFWFVYMIRAENRALYTGIATDVERRFKEHLDVFYGRSNKGAKYFRGRKPLEVVYREQYVSRSEASGREYQLKKMSARAKRALIGESISTV